METTDYKQQYYVPHASFVKSTVRDCDKPTLPEELQWAAGRVHPLFMSVMLPYLTGDERFSIGIGENAEGPFLSVYDDREDEVMRMTVHLNRIGKTSGWLGDRRTSPAGIWMLGGESFESPPFASPMTRRSPFHDMRNVLKAVQVFGSDEDLDVLHRGTYVEHSLGRPSRVTEHYSIGSVIWTLSHRPARWGDENMDFLTLHIEDQCALLSDSIVIRTTNDLNTLETAYFFPVDGDYGRNGEVLEEDATIIIDNDCLDDNGVPLRSEDDPIFLTVMNNSNFVGDDNRVRCVAEQLVSYGSNVKVSHLPSSLGERYQKFIVTPLTGGFSNDRMYRVRVRP